MAGRAFINECTALGAAYLAGLQVGIYSDLDDIAAKWSVRKAYAPSMEQGERDDLLNGWQAALGMLLS